MFISLLMVFVLGVFLASILKVLGKHPQGKILKEKSWRASKGLQLVHNDVAGLIPTLSFQSARYLLTSIDDNSKQTWVYILKNKSEAFDTFLEAIWKCLSNVCRESET